MEFAESAVTPLLSYATTQQCLPSLSLSAIYFHLTNLPRVESASITRYRLKSPFPLQPLTYGRSINISEFTLLHQATSETSTENEDTYFPIK